MSLNLFVEIILLLLTILAFNGFIYSLTLFKLNKKNSSENIPVITNSSEKDVLTPTLLLASNHLRITSSESSSSETSIFTSSDWSASETLYEDETSSDTVSETSNDTNLSDTVYEILPEDRFGNIDLTEEDMKWLYDPYVITRNNLEIGGGPLPSETDVYAISLDSITQLSRENYEQWRAISGDLHDLPLNTPYNILRQVKLEELNILYREDLIEFSITQTELALIIEQVKPLQLWSPDINHFILTILSYYHG